MKNPNLNSLGMAQANLEFAAKELRAAQAAHKKATERLALAEEGHQLANVLLIKEVDSVRSNSKVVPNLLK